MFVVDESIVGFEFLSCRDRDLYCMLLEFFFVVLENNVLIRVDLVCV